MSSTGGGALGFLTTGTTPGQSQQESESSTALPSWYTDYTQQILNSAAQYAAQPYQAYQGPRIASQSGLTNDAYGEATPLSGTATAGTQAAQNLVQQGANQNNPLGTAQPDLNQGASMINGSVAPGTGGLSAAQSYLNSAANPTYNTVQNYMNPYNQDVTSAIANAANTNFNNYTLPALQSSVIGSGNITGNSTQGANLLENAEQQNEQNITNAQSQALQSGYAGAQSAAQAGATTQAGLANTAGQLGTQQQTAQQNAGTDIANIGATAGNLNATGAQTAITAGGALQNVNSAGTTNNINAINAQNTLGQQDQGYTQANENLAYQDFENQLNYPLTQASAMQGALAGVQVPTTTTNYGASTGTPATIGNSPLVTAAGALSGLGASTTPPATSQPTNYNTATPGYS
jgi:hypothetical protein